MKPSYTARFNSARRGFAIIVTLFLMILLTVIAVGLLTLSAVSLRTSTQGQADAEARANARLALMMAISELQSLAGPDQRVTAPAEAVTGVNGRKQVLGVWRSWEGRDHDAIGTPVAPDYKSKLVAGDQKPDTTNAGRFLGWFTSDAVGQTDASAPPKLEKTAETIPLLRMDAVSDEIHVKPTAIRGRANGSLAWWISGENAKAFVKHTEPPDTPHDWALHNATFNRADPKVFGLTDEAKLNRIPSRGSFDLVAGNGSAGSAQRPSKQYFHDLTPWSQGLLINAATGGWKRDLSLATEDWTSLKAADKSFFTLRPGVKSPSPQADLFPWEAGRSPAHWTGAVNWEGIRDFATQYRNLLPSGAGGAPAMNGQVFSYDDLNRSRNEVRRYPVVARIHLVISYSAKPNPDPAAPANQAYIACLDVNPAVTLWNPYNVALTIDGLNISIPQPSDAGFRFSVDRYGAGGFSRTDSYNRITMNGILENQPWAMRCVNDSGQGMLTFQPGEALLFSAKDNSPVGGGQTVKLYPGYKTNGGFRYDRLDNSSGSLRAIYGGASDRFYSRVVRDAGGRGDWDFKRGVTFSVQNDQFAIAAFTENGSAIGGNYQITNPAPGDGPADKLQMRNLASSPDPFYASYISLDAASIEQPVESGPTGKGLLGNNPLNYQTRGNIGIDSIWHIKNFPLNGTNGGIGLPEAYDARGFVGATHQADGGLTHLPLVELPLRPLRSLAELQHCDISCSMKSPYGFNVIGNSHAYPAISPATIESLAYDNKPGYQDWSYDYSYVANHLLFDDWFVSSIAPETVPWTAAEARSKKSVYRDHLLLAEPLPNDFYLPSTAANETNVDARVTGDIGSPDAWQTIASKLLVRGMFNVNSTSVPAWKAVLRNMRDSRVPEFGYGASGAWKVEAGDANNDQTSFPRSTVTGSGETNIGNYPELGNYHPLTDTRIDALAREIVKQIKLRGPFLSLSEFVNRKLTTATGAQLTSANPDSELVRAGAIEAALLTLSDPATAAGNENPNGELQSIFPEQTRPGGHSSGFPYAGEGSIVYGYPGWIRQADILRSLAPVISVRDDSFVIRSYGDYRDPANGKIVARAWCEAVVQRTAEYVDPKDEPTVLPGTATLASGTNARFGRCFRIVAFRWLSPDEI